MDKNQRITYRVPDRFKEKVERHMKINKLGDADFLNKVIENFFNPPPIPEPIIKEVFVDKIIEVPTVVEVIKEVMIDREGTVIEGAAIQISKLLSEELTKIKSNPEMSLDAFVGDICWGRIKWSQTKKSPATAQTNGTSQYTTYETSQARVLYWKKQIANTESWDEAGQDELREGIMADTLLTEKDRNSLTQKRR